MLVAAWMSPLHIPPWLAAHSDLLAASAAGTLGLAGLAATANRISIPLASVFFVALACVPAIQFAAGQIRFGGDAWTVFLYLACAAWTSLWSMRVAQTDSAGWSHMLAAAMLAGALCSVILILLQRLDVTAGLLRSYVVEVRPGYPPGGNLAQPNQATTLLGLGLVSLMLLFERGQVGIKWSLCAAFLMTVAMAATASRTGLLLFAAASVGVWVLRRRVGLRTRPSVVVALAAVWFTAFLAWGRIADVLYLRPMLSTLESRTNAGSRTVIWEQLWVALQLRPWAGYGWNQVGTAQMTVAEHLTNSRLVASSHSLPLDLMIWNGAPLAVVIVSVALWWLGRSLRRLSSTAGAFGMLVMALLLTHALVEFPLEYLYFLVPFAMAIGIVAADTRRPPRLTLPRWAGGLGVGIYLVVFGWAAADYMNVESAFRDMRFSIARIGGPMPSRPPPMLDTQFTQLAAQHRSWLSVSRSGMSPEEVRFSADVSSRFAFAPLLYRHALAQAFNGDMPGARITLQRLKGLHPAAVHGAAIAQIRELTTLTQAERAALTAP